MAIRRPRPPATPWGRAFELSLEAGLAVVLGVVIGVYLDNRFDTEPVFLFVFLVLGFVTFVRRLLSIRPPQPAAPDDEPGARDPGEGR